MCRRPSFFAPSVGTAGRQVRPPDPRVGALSFTHAAINVVLSSPALSAPLRRIAVLLDPATSLLCGIDIEERFLAAELPPSLNQRASQW